MLRRFNSLLPLLFLAVLGVAVYAPGLYGGFVFDDYPNLVDDNDWKVTAGDPSEWLRAVWSGTASSFGRPLAMLTFAGNHFLTGLDPFWLKATNLLIHLLNGSLVFLLCRRLFDLAPATHPNERLGRFAAWLLAAIWLTHPLLVSTTLYVVQRMELGAHTFVLVSLHCYLRARSESSPLRQQIVWGLLAIAAMLLGLGFKETAALVPAYALTLELFVLKFRATDGRPSRALQALYACGVTMGILLFFAWAMPHFTSSDAYAPRDFSLAQRLWTQGPVLLTYLRQMVLPLPDSLTFYYDNFPLSNGPLSPVNTALALLVLSSLVATAILARRRWPLVSLGITWFFFAHSLTSNIVPFELAFEHRNYFALVGVLIAVAQLLAVATVSLSLEARRLVAAAAAATVALLCCLQVNTWGDPMRLASSLASRNIDSPRASYEYGKLLLAHSGSDPDSVFRSMARKEFEHSASLPGSSALAEQALIIMAARTGHEIPAQVWKRFRQKLTQRTIGAEGELALHAVLDCRVKGQCQFDDQALFQTLVETMDRNPQSTTVRSFYGNFAYNVIGDRPLGIEVMRDVVAMSPTSVTYKVNLAKFLAHSGQAPEELQRLRSEIRANNRDGAHTNDLKSIDRLTRGQL